MTYLGIKHIIVELCICWHCKDLYSQYLACTAYHIVLSYFFKWGSKDRIMATLGTKWNRFHYFMFWWPCITIHLCDKNQLDALFILSPFHQSTSTCFGHICSPSSGGILYTRFVQKVSGLTTVHEVHKAYGVLILIIFNIVPFRSYTLRPKLLPLLETFCELLFRDV